MRSNISQVIRKLFRCISIRDAADAQTCDRALVSLACAVHCDLAGSPETLAVVGAAGDKPRPRCQDDHRHDACQRQHDLVSVSLSHHIIMMTYSGHCYLSHWCPLTELGSHPPSLVPTVPAPARRSLRHESLVTDTGHLLAQDGSDTSNNV